MQMEPWIGIAFNALVLLAALYRVGVFMGRMETRLDNVERRLERIEGMLDHRDARV